MSQFSGSTIGNYSRFWLILTGVILLATGVVMAVALGSIPFAGGAMLGTGGLLAVVGLILIVIGLIVGRRASATNQILQTGIQGTATITGATQTGMTVNENPQIRLNLLVQLPGEVPYAATHTSIVPLMLLGRLSSGAPLTVRVDQMDRSKVVIDWSQTGFVAPQMPMMGAMPAQQGFAGSMPGAMAAAPMTVGSAGSAGSNMDESLNQVQAALAQSGSAAAPAYASAAQGNYTVEQLRAYLRQSGLQASAHVDKLEDTGKVVGDERLYTMVMTLNIPGQAPQKLPESAAMVPIAVSHKLFQGMNVPVRYAAENPNLLMVEWDKV